MGAGLAAQRGWPQGQEDDPSSPQRTGTSSSSGEEPPPSSHLHSRRSSLLLFEETADTSEVQPLEDSDFARNYGSSASLASLVPLDRKRWSSIEAENGNASVGSGSAGDAAEDDHLEARDGRERRRRCCLAGRLQLR
ncbi:hypothetical protein Esi_0002_0005 [Ectocarpus siliculosus]|uniref:Uncharacterized protein n=1 Tax=Ectocarpus siliculosus TaxID=2880 RepID=D7FPW0_ECTSI|nr:hypothetical protein Esi_0002_0005 [Ectocarpus siliculosus]|eukprot:CBJ48291.1 hypothetical protein Esi_0002_0005 [Ectocarpus siliculosus]